MWSAIGALLTLLVMSYKAWLDLENKKQEEFDAKKKAISDAVASGDVASINGIINSLRR
jgi:hypothetical protein